MTLVPDLLKRQVYPATSCATWCTLARRGSSLRWWLDIYIYSWFICALYWLLYTPKSICQPTVVHHTLTQILVTPLDFHIRRWAGWQWCLAWCFFGSDIPQWIVFQQEFVLYESLWLRPPGASWWWQGQLLICSQGIFEIPVEIWSVFILTNCWALQKQGFLCCGTEAAECSDHRFKALAWNTERDLREGMSKLLDPSWTKTYRRMFLWRAHSSVSVVLNFRFERIPGQSPLWSRTSAWSEFQSLVAQPWSAKSHQDRFRAATLFLGCWFYSIYMFWQEVLLKTTWGGGLSCWNNFCILCMVEIPSWTYSKFFESCCCLYFTSRFDFAPGHDLESARVQHEAQILQELGSSGISKCPDSPDLLKDWHLSTINPNFAGASLPCASWWWQGQLLICSQGIFEIPVEIWSVFILTNCWALQKQGFLCCGTEAAECSDHRFKALAWNTERDLREGMSKLLDPSWTKTYRRMFLWRAHSSVSVVLNFRFERIPGQSPLWSRTSSWSEFQSLVAQPWSAKSHQDRFRAETLFLGCWFYSIYMFWQEVLLKTTWGGELSCWNNFCILCMVEIPSWTYSKFFESCCCLYFTSRFDFAPGHDLESARVQHEAQILQELGSSGISKCPDCPDLLV